MRLYGEIIPSFNDGIIDRTGAQTMLYITCTTITSVDLAHYGVSRAKDCVSVDCGTMFDSFCDFSASTIEQMNCSTSASPREYSTKVNSILFLFLVSSSLTSHDSIRCT